MPDVRPSARRLRMTRRSFWRRIRAWVLLFVLLTLSLITLLSRDEPVVRGLRASMLELSGWVETHFSWAGAPFRAVQENAALRREAVELASEAARSRQARIENERLRRLLGFRDTTTYRVRAARIIAKDLGENLFTLDVGRRDSVEPGMAVIDERGILGKVLLVSDRYARVMPYQNTRFFVPGTVQPIQAEGIVRWMGGRPNVLTMENVVRTEPVLPGQLVVTSGYSGIFPAGWPVGLVDSVATLAGRNELLIHLTPSAPLSKARHAFVVLQKPDDEQERLEAEARRLLSEDE